jgi:hypothetical protein
VIERRWELHGPVVQSWTAWHRLYDVSGLRALLEQAGFGDVASYGGLDGRELARAKDCAVIVGRA